MLHELDSQHWCVLYKHMLHENVVNYCNRCRYALSVCSEHALVSEFLSQSKQRTARCAGIKTDYLSNSMFSFH